MSNVSLILGESGTGKSTSIRNLVPEETFIINIIDKPLPFKGYKSKYKAVSADWLTGNYCSTDNYQQIIKALNFISNKRPEINTIIIDDFQFVMANEFMRSADVKGYDKFTHIGQHAWMIMNTLKDLREDIDCFVLSHSEQDENGKMRAKTIGKLLSEKYGLEAAVAMLLQTEVANGQYKFVTQCSNRYIAKSPMGMFEEMSIPNDLAFVKTKMYNYYHDEVAT